MESQQCLSCGESFKKRPQIKNHLFCPAKKCQSERKRRWGRAALRDPDHRENQTLAQKSWAEKNPEYWRGYRHANPDYCRRNRAQQRVRNEKRKAAVIAKMDVSASRPLPLSGVYRLTPLAADGIAKMDAWIAEIRLISPAYCDVHTSFHKSDTKLQREDLMGSERRVADNVP